MIDYKNKKMLKNKESIKITPYIIYINNYIY